MSSEVQIAVIDQQDTQIVLAVPGVQGATGSNIPTGGTANQVLRKASSTNYDTDWSLVTNAMVDSSAAIAGTKISPNFGSQNVVTTGTATAASFIPTSSSVPTNGVYLPSANNVAISTNGTGRLFVDADGNVILGASSLLSGASGRVLQIGNTSDAASTLQFAATTTGSSYIQFGDSGSPGSYAGYLQYGHTDNFLAIGTNSTEKLRIDSSGRLGLGTSSPSYRLHAVQASEETNPENNAGAYWLFQNSSTTLNTCSALSLGTNSDIGTTVVAQRVGANNEHVLKFQVRNSSGSLGTRMTLTGSGSLGIGTSSPSGTFTVYDSGNQIVLNAPTSSNSNITFQENGSNKWIAGYVPFISAFRFSNGSSDILTLTNAGNVGIGTTSPGAALEIVGGSANDVNTPAVFIQNDRFLTFKNTTGTWAGAASATTSNNLLIAAVNNLTLATGANADERARIDSSGRLLIGTSSHSGGSLLQVNDNRIRIATAKTPASATDTGVAGEICWDASYIYVCTATNTWKRTAIATW
jgi:hypothetical protein